MCFWFFFSTLYCSVWRKVPPGEIFCIAIFQQTWDIAFIDVFRSFFTTWVLSVFFVFFFQLVSNLIMWGGKKANNSSSPATKFCTIYITENWMLKVQKARVSRVSHEISIGAYVAQWNGVKLLSRFGWLTTPVLVGLFFPRTNKARNCQGVFENYEKYY